MSLLRFNLAAIPAGARFEMGFLWLRQMSVTGSFARTVDVSLVGAAWNELTVRWNNKPALGATIGHGLNQGLANGPYSMQLTGPRPMSDLANGLYLTQATDATRSWSREGTGPVSIPTVILCYTVPD